jgi:hypothetical protein
MVLEYNEWIFKVAVKRKLLAVEEWKNLWKILFILSKE